MIPFVHDGFAYYDIIERASFATALASVSLYYRVSRQESLHLIEPSSN